MVWRLTDPQGDEAAKCKHDIVKYTRGVVLDMGCGPSKAFPHFVGVDSLKDTELFGIQMKPDVVCDVANPIDVALTFEPGSCDAIFSSHCLEHIVDAPAALAAWWSLIKPGGHLCLYLPDEALYPRMGEPGANPDHVHDLSREKIIAWMEDVGSWDLLVNEQRADGCEYSFLQVYQKLSDE